MKKITVLSLSVLMAAGATAAAQFMKEGLVEYAGAQKNIFATGKAEPSVTLADMVTGDDVYGVGAVAGLDGEITIFKGKPYVTQVRGDSYTLDNSHEHGAVFAVWSHQAEWRETSVPAETKTYLELQQLVKTQATAAGIDVSKPFPFRLIGTPAQVKWHINVDLTEGKPITKELFAKSKANYVAQDQAMDIIGFYSENHPGVFISAYAPAITPDSGNKNAIHIHLVSQDGKAAGHIDDLTLAPGMKLLLPQS